MSNVTELRPGNHFTSEGQIFTVLESSLNKTAMRKMVVQLKVKNLRSGAITEMKFLGGSNIDRITLDKKKMQFLYESSGSMVFMDNATYEQIEMQKTRIEWESNFLRGDETVEILFYENEILGISLPAKVALKVKTCEPAVKGDTINRAMKEAIMETGLKVKVPLFIQEGEDILVRTEDGTYDSRA
jgi:elongation factor P